MTITQDINSKNEFENYTFKVTSTVPRANELIFYDNSIWKNYRNANMF